MYKNQLQELAQRSCFNLPSYTCIREGPDHAPRFKATVNFNGETFESPHYCSTLRQAEHSAAEMALNALAGRGPSNSLAARILPATPTFCYEVLPFPIQNKCKQLSAVLCLAISVLVSLSCIEMYKNRLHVLAQKSCFNFPSYSFVREGPDHAPRFKAIVNFNGEKFESPNFCSTLRQAEHSAAEVALKAFASSEPFSSLAARILDETGVYKNLLQEVSQRVGASLPVYETFRSGLGHLPVFTCTVELAGIIFTGEPAKNKKQAEKNAAMAAWTSLKLMVQQSEISTSEKAKNDEQEHVTVARALQKYLFKARLAKETFPIRFPTQNTKPPTSMQPPATSSKILPFICPRPARNRAVMAAANSSSISSKISPQSRSPMGIVNEMVICPKTTQGQPSSPAVNNNLSLPTESHWYRCQKFPAAGAAPYIPIRHFSPHQRIAPPVTIRNAIPVYSSPPIPPPSQSPRLMRPPTSGMAPPVCLRQAIPSYSAPPVRLEQLSLLDSAIQEEPPFPKPPVIKFEEPLGSKVPQTQIENPISAKAISGVVQEPMLSKAPAIPVEVLSGSSIKPSSEVLPVRVELPACSTP